MIKIVEKDNLPSDRVRMRRSLLLKDESAWDSQVLACNFAKYLPILKNHWQPQQ